MKEEPQTFSPGKWIVHRLYGVSQVIGMEKRQIGEHENTYCKMQNDASTFWMPLDKLNEEWLRPVASAAELQLALEVLMSAPKRIEANPNVRRNMLNKVVLHATPAETAELLRDLWAYKKEKKHISQHEERTLRLLTNCFMAEWSVCLDLEMAEVEQRFHSIVHPEKS